MITEHEKRENDTRETEDAIENLLIRVRDNADSIDTLMKILDKLEKGGAREIVEKIAEGGIPSDALYLFEFFTSEPMRQSLLQGGNLVLLLMHALTDEKTSDALKALASNVNYIADTAASYTKDSDRPNVLKLYSAIRDPDVNFAIMSMMGALKATGRILREMKKERKMMESLLK